MRKITMKKALELTVETRQLMKDNNTSIVFSNIQTISRKHRLGKLTHSCFLCEVNSGDCKLCPIHVTTGKTCADNDRKFHLFEPDKGLSFIFKVQKAYLSGKKVTDL